MALSTTTPSLYKGVLTAGVRALGPLFYNFVGESGQPMPVTVRDIYGSSDVSPPSITLSLRSGKAIYNTGNNLIGLDTVTNQFYYGYYLPNAKLRLLVQTVGDAGEGQREWLVDTIISGLTSFSVPDTTNTPNYAVPGSVVDALGAFGIVVNGHDDIDYREVDLDGARYKGQVYEARIPLLCSVSLGWEAAGVSALQFLINPAFTIARTTITEPQLTVQ